MAFDAYLYFEGPSPGSPELQGETQDSYFKNKKAFEISSFGFGAENTCTIGSASSGAGGGRCTFNKFTITKFTDKASPKFFQHVAAGTHFKKVFLSLRKSGGGTTSGYPYLTYTFSLVFVNKIDWKGSTGDDQPTEDIEFAYGALKVEYFPQKQDGTMDKVVDASWSQILNKATDAVS